MSSFLILLLSVAALGHTPPLTAAQQTPSTSQCGQRRCPNDPLPPGWISNIGVPQSQRRATSAQLSWDRDPNLMDGLRYRVVWREFNTQGNFSITSGPEHPTREFTLRNLTPDTRYDVLVCLSRLDVADLTNGPASTTLSLPECGFCSFCFRTDEVFFNILLTETSPLSPPLVSLTCEIESNVDFNIEWRVEILDPETGDTRRERLNAGELFDMVPIEIIQADPVIEESGNIIVTSELIISDSIFEMENVDCRARSPFMNSQPSMPGAFQQVDPDLNRTVVFPVWGIALLVVLPILIITFVVILIVAICIVLTWKRKKLIKLQDEGQRRYKKPSTNTYLERSFGATKVPVADEKPLDSEAITSLTEAIPDDMFIDSSLVNVSTIIGQGEFGVVYKGMLKKGRANEVVAVKSLKGIFVTENDVQNALKEILKMKDFDHHNVMTLIGVCRATGVSGGAPSIIMPYMARGSLLSYLRKERDQLMPGPDDDITQVGAIQKLLMQICLQISQGMAYLASLRFVHRDLAARNCMIDEKGVIKVSDFGLAEDIYMRNYFRQSSQDSVKLPLKWMAPESIKLGIFSEKSDVWAYGVTCWEVFTAGEIPYPGVHPQEVVQMLEDGRQLNRPKNQACYDNMYGIMKSCWAYRPEDRPEFEELASSLNSELTALAEYVDLSMFAEESNVNTASEE